MAKKKKTSKKKTSKTSSKKTSSKPAAKKKPRALVAAEDRVKGLKLLVLAADYARQAHAELRTSAPKKCTAAIARARAGLQRALRACD